MLAKLLNIIKPASQIEVSDVIDEDSHQWILDTFSWAITHFDVLEFKSNSQLVLPNNQFYQGSVNSVHEMALSIFKQTTAYAGMQQWPIILITPEQFFAGSQQIAIPPFNMVDHCRGENTPFAKLNEEDTAKLQQQPIMLSYGESQVNQPQDLISSIVQNLANILIVQQTSLPPGGKEFIPQAVDVIACFMGFGVIFSNTAYQFKGGCGSCNNPNANRQSALPENETLHALALFCLLKAIKPNAVKPHLKSHLRKQFSLSYHALSNTIKNSTDPVLLSLL
ncbi:hypothetical protein [Colwellia hornerae]|uniref:Uncharacterized protein n=1 Tax=Colwellia hornerae TaxID=89402 RepID=A0A5C6Q893_9GAMM|nr:hypothetical protein [Colwellia hornerae]TWX57775.1 hypothetical protein ESZ28_03445 [Colwellia hornerae]TWX62494.1 hypothetical protein ESZ26_01240 [Colwellia hornerae]TWX65053.1 hypothetical protein ESZ27_13105 [Colwellia hornerae]